MVGIFSRFSNRASHRRSQSALDERRVLPPSSVAATTTTAILSTATSSVPHGIEVTVEFKPVEHPTEPLDNDQPIQCPQPEPSILNDGRIWKERVSSGASRRGEADAILPEEITEIPRTRPRPPNRHILPSMSAPEHNILKLLEECNASGISFNT